MLDAHLRRIIEPALDALARPLAERGLGADQATLAGFAIGLLAVPLLAIEAYGAALAAILLNRALDGLDGALARRAGTTDFGGFLDIVCDFVFYAAVPAGFALARPEENALAALFLVVSFTGTGASFLAYAALAARRRMPASGRRGLAYLGGLTEGGETIAFFVLACLWPGAFVPLALGFGALCWATVVFRVLAARADFTPEP